MTPETRYIETYTYPDDLPAEGRTPDKAIITRTPYEVSDEELELELGNRYLQELKAKEQPYTIEELGEMLKLIMDRLGI